MRLSIDRYAALLAAGLLMALLGALAITGKSPDLGSFVRFEEKGLVALSPSATTRIEITAGRDRFGFQRQASGSWSIESGAGAAPVPEEFGAHLEAALRFMHVSAPTRSLEPGDLGDARFADFGLDPPTYVVALAAGDKTVATVDFGALNPPQTSQYVRVIGEPRVYLMPRHVGAEWQVATDMARRLLPPDAVAEARRDGRGFLLPVTMSQIWAVELVFEGKLHRFERDGAGSWFLHTGQHSHAGNRNQHVADPVQAPIIGAALAAFEQTRIEALVEHRPSSDALARLGLALPPLIIMLYPRDSSTPVARLELGNRAADGFSRYTRLAQNGDVVTIADYEAKRLTDLLRAVGAGS